MSTEFHVGPPGCGFTSLLAPYSTACSRWANTQTSTHKKTKTACNTGESCCAECQVRVGFLKRSVSFNASCENIIKQLTNYQRCQMFSGWTPQSAAWVTKQFSRTAGKVSGKNIQTRRRHYQRGAEGTSRGAQGRTQTHCYCIRAA